MPNSKKPRDNQSAPKGNSNPKAHAQPHPSNSTRPSKPFKKFTPKNTLTPPPVATQLEAEPPVANSVPVVSNVPPDYVIVAQISSPFGLRGGVKAEIRTDFPERFDRLREVFLLSPEDRTTPLPYVVMSAKVQNLRQVVIRFEGITKIEQAEKLRGYSVTVPLADVVALPEDEYYLFQIIGLEVYNLQDELVGQVINVLNYPANDVYIVRGPMSSKDVLIPAIKDVVQKIDLENKRITIDLLEGLI